MDLKELKEAQDRIQKLQKAKAKAEGAISQILQNLKKSYGVSTIEEAKELAKDLQGKLKEIETKLAKKEKDFEEKWRDELEKMSQAIE